MIQAVDFRRIRLERFTGPALVIDDLRRAEIQGIASDVSPMIRRGNSP